jgi:hypothetical protein
MHSCSHATDCPCERNDEGHYVCGITGYCKRMLNFSEKEFVDTVCYTGPAGAVKKRSASGSSVSLNYHNPKRARKSQSYSVNCIPSVHQHRNIHGINIDSSCIAVRNNASNTNGWGSVNKKNRYRSWVHHRIHNNSDGASTAADADCSSTNASSAASVYPKSTFIIHDQPIVMDAQDETENIRALIESYVGDILCSCKWIDSMKMEARRPDRNVYNVHVCPVIFITLKTMSAEMMHVVPAGEENGRKEKDADAEGNEITESFEDG